MNWHAVAIAGFSFIAFCAFCALVAALVSADDSKPDAMAWTAIMLVLMAVDTFLAGAVWA